MQFAGSTGLTNKMMSTITWLSIKAFFRRVWAWCKKYWQLFVGALIPFILWAITRNPSRLDGVVTRIREDHARELDAINNAHAEELEKKALAEKIYLETVLKIEDKSIKDSQELSLKKKKEIKRIIEKHADNPDEITRRLAEELGLKFMSGE